MTYPIGTICIAHGLWLNVHHNGMECEILELPRLRVCTNPLRGRYKAVAYRVRWADGVVSSVGPENLRKKPPREDFKGELRIIEMFKERETA